MPAEEGVPEEIVVVVSGGEPPTPHAALAVPLGAPVVAADEGLEHALALGLEVTVAVGDFDSASPEAVAVAEASETRVERHPPDKDATDLELALDLAASMSPERILVLAGDGGRLDHLLGTLLLLGSDRYASSQVDAFIGGARVHVIRTERSLDGAPGELLSLLPVHGAAERVTTEGLAYPLSAETLEAGTTRGVSNVFSAETACVSLERGVLVALRPGGGAA
jgi:thiamine pyrophosphokinase